ncbi:MAG: SOS response-associated peptidase [Hyphomicrobiaceae bacterium]
MCSRYSLTSPPEAVRAYFRHRNEHGYPPRYNIAPTQPVGIVRTAESGYRDFQVVRWGLIPPWVKDPRTFTTLINARAETAAEKPSFRGAFRHKRCLVPADGFYEWTGPVGGKRPHLIRRRDHGLLAFAGLFESWLGADGSEVDTMAILTVAANATVDTVHDRMPAILPPEQFDAWLDCRNIETKQASAMLQPAPVDLLEIIEVDPRLNNSRNEGPQLQQPVGQSRLL